MSNIVENLSTLAKDAPTIVVTEPSPLSIKSTSVTAVTTPLTNVETVKTPMTTVLSEEPNVAPAVTTEVTQAEESREFHPAPNCEECIVPVDAKQDNVVQMVDDESDSTRSRETIENSSRVRCFSEYGGPCNFYRQMSESLAVSKYLLPMLSLLLAFPIFMAYMGVQYMDECPMSGSLPLLMFIIGVTGAFMIICRMALIIKKHLTPESSAWWCTESLMVAAHFIFILAVVTEVTVFLRLSPSFDPDYSNYCSKTFHDFAFWANCALLVLSGITLLLFYPACKSVNTENIYRNAP